MTETKALLKNSKIFLPPPQDGCDIKEILRRVVSSGAGRNVGEDGFPPGSWSPELLAEAISQLDSNGVGVDLRTVQHWFQDNEKGISQANIRWLARVLGCDDPNATSEWQIALGAAQSRLAARRRKQRTESEGVVNDQTSEVDESIVDHAQRTNRDGRSLSLAVRTEAIFSKGSPLDLPSAVFGGAVALGFLSYLLGIHSIRYDLGDGALKEVGFLWAPNWTLLFMVLMPLSFTVASNCLALWKQYRQSLDAEDAGLTVNKSWSDSYSAFNHTHWIVLIICLVFAGVIQWIAIRLRPILSGEGHYAPDWGNFSNIRPDLISAPTEVLFTGLAYLYMAVFFYLFFSSLILVFAITHDYAEITSRSGENVNKRCNFDCRSIAYKIFTASFRCTCLGLLIAICMKLQSTYTATGRGNIIVWMFDDALSGLSQPLGPGTSVAYSLPTHYSSLIVALSSLVVFISGTLNLEGTKLFRRTLGKMTFVVAILCCAYLLIGSFVGFSILLFVSVLLALCGILRPGFGRDDFVDGEG